MLDLLLGVFYVLGIAAGVIFKDDIMWAISKLKDRIGSDETKGGRL